MRTFFSLAALALFCTSASIARSTVLDSVPHKKGLFIFAGTGVSAYGLRHSMKDFMEAERYNYAQESWFGAHDHPHLKANPSWQAGLEGNISRLLGCGVVVGQANDGRVSGYSPGRLPYEFEITYSTFFAAPYVVLSTPARDYEFRVGPLAAWHQTASQNFTPENKVFVGSSASTFQAGAMAAGFLRLINKKSGFLRLGAAYSFAGKATFGGVRATKPDGEVLVAAKKIDASMLSFSLEGGLRIR